MRKNTQEVSEGALTWRISRMLIASKRRDPVGRLLRGSTLACTTAMILLGFTSIRAEESTKNAGSSNTGGGSGQLRWTRNFRDTFVLNQSFADRFRGTPEDTKATLRKELSKLAGEPVDDVILALSADKRTLVVEYSEKRAKKIEPTVTHLLAKQGWWNDPREERQQAYDRALRPFRVEVEKQRLNVEVRAVEAEQLREAAGIIDSDPENPSTIYYHSDNPKEELTRVQLTDVKVKSYIVAKVRYINSKKILEAAELRLSVESGGGATLDMHARE